MLKSKILARLLNSTSPSKLKKLLLKKIIKQAKKNIKTGKDTNNQRFKKRKTKLKNKILYKTGDLYKSLKIKRNKFSMLKYGLYNQLGTKKGIDSRKFVPTSGSKQFNFIAKQILKGL